MATRLICRTVLVGRRESWIGDRVAFVVGDDTDLGLKMRIEDYV